MPSSKAFYAILIASIARQVTAAPMPDGDPSGLTLDTSPPPSNKDCVHPCMSLTLWPDFAHPNVNPDVWRQPATGDPRLPSKDISTWDSVTFSRHPDPGMEFDFYAETECINLIFTADSTTITNADPEHKYPLGATSRCVRYSYEPKD